MLDPLACIISGLEEYDALNKIEGKNYDLDYYASKENLVVNFAEELDDEIETQGGGSKALKSDHPDPSTKDQTKSKLKAVVSGGASRLEGCLEIPTTSGGFDDNLIINFSLPIL